MDEHSGSPVQGISGRQAADILGIRELSVSRLVTRGVLSKAVRGAKYGLDLADVERLALEQYTPLLAVDQRGSRVAGRHTEPG